MHNRLNKRQFRTGCEFSPWDTVSRKFAAVVRCNLNSAFVVLSGMNAILRPLVAVVLVGGVNGFAADHPGAIPSSTAANQVHPGSPFAPYAFLVGEWDVKADDDSPPAAIIRVQWGPNRSYIWYSSSLLIAGPEEPHLAGMLVWNGVNNNLDMLFSMDLRSGRVQEHGTMTADADGSVVRDITAVYGPRTNAIGLPPVGPQGATAHFHETYKKLDGNKILTSAMRETDHGWVATFPGSDHLIMTRRSSSSQDAGS